MTRNKEIEKPFSIILSRKQLAFLTQIKKHLKEVYEDGINENNYDDDACIHILIEALFMLPLPELNIYMLRVYGEFKSTTELAELLHVTKLTVCNHIRKSKQFIKEYIKKHPYKK